MPCLIVGEPTRLAVLARNTEHLKDRKYSVPNLYFELVPKVLIKHNHWPYCKRNRYDKEENDYRW